MLLKCEDVQGKNVLTNFAGMDFTTDKLRSLVRKWFSLIETFVDVKTTDGYSLRVFCMVSPSAAWTRPSALATRSPARSARSARR